MGPKGIGGINLTEMLPKEGSAIEVSEMFKKDADFLGSLSEKHPTKITEKIINHFQETNKPGSAVYMDIFSKSAMFDAQLKQFENGGLTEQMFAEGGFVRLIDFDRTTGEMLQNGQVVLTQDARSDFLGCANKFGFKLKQHIQNSATAASTHYAKVLTTETSVIDRIKEMLGRKPEPFEIPFKPNEEEFTRLKEVFEGRYTSQQELQQTMQNVLRQMMQQRPGLIGLESTASANQFVAKIAEELGGNPNQPINSGPLRRLHGHMKGQGMEELQIYPDFGDAIESSIEESLKN